MSHEDFDLLMARWLAGETSEEDESRLADTLRASEEARLRFVELSDQEAALRVMAQSVVQAQEIRERCARPDTRFLRRPRLRRGPGRAPLLGAAIAAASVAFALVVLAAALSSKPSLPGRPEVVQTLEPPAAVRGEEHRLRLEDRLKSIESERERLERPEVPAPADPATEEKRRQALARLEEDRRSVEEEMRRTIEAARPRAPEAARAPATEKMTEVAAAPVARLERVEGEVVVVAGESRSAARAASDLLAGQSLETVGAASSAVLVFPDQTRLTVGGDAELRGIADRQARPALGRRVFVKRGAVLAEATKQPPDQPMVIASAHGEARVLGTTFRVAVDAASMRLEVQEGRVRLVNRQTGRSVDVPAGQFAVAGAGIPLASRPLPVDDVFLLAAQAARVGTDWRPVKDEKALGGEALECRGTADASKTDPKNPAVDSKSWSREYVEFRFVADANRDYHVWIRGASVADANGSWFDQMALEAPTGRLTGRPWGETPVPAAAMVNGHGTRSGYWWIGGNADGDAAGARGDVPPATVRFSRSGTQVLRLHAWHKPILMRIDALWLSASRSTRPEDGQAAPKK